MQGKRDFYVCKSMELNLEKSELDLLRELQRNTSDRHAYQKLTMLIMLHHQMSMSSISELLGVDETTLYRHYHQYKASSDLPTYLARHYRPFSGKLTQAQQAGLKEYLRVNLCHSSKVVAHYIKENYGVSYSWDGVICLLHRLGFSYKKTRLVPSGCDEDKQEKWCESFKELSDNLLDNEVILFGDGVHPKHNTETDYAWIQTGSEFEIPANTGRQRVNINGAINPKDVTEVIAHECDSINALTSIVFLSKIEGYYPQKQKIHLFVDNARYYKSKLVAEYVKSSRIQLHFLPAYSPNLNPIERLWKYLKKKVIKSNYTPDFDVFQQRIRDFFANIGNYKDELESLINTNFQIIKPLHKDLQTSLR